MADAYWRYAAADPRQQQQQQPQPPSAGGGIGHPGMGGGAPQMAPAVGQQQQQPMKRPRPADFSGPSARPRFDLMMIRALLACLPSPLDLPVPAERLGF